MRKSKGEGEQRKKRRNIIEKGSKEKGKKHEVYTNTVTQD